MNTAHSRREGSRRREARVAVACSQRIGVAGLALLSLAAALTLSACYTQIHAKAPQTYPDRAYGPAAEPDGPPPRVPLPREGTLVLVVQEEFDRFRLDRWALVQEGPWPGGGPDLECEVRATSSDSERISFRYPGASAWVCEVSAGWGNGSIVFPQSWRFEESLPFADYRVDPDGFRVYRHRGRGDWVWFEESAYDLGRVDDLYQVWDAVSDRELVAAWVEDGGWVGVYRVPYFPQFDSGKGPQWIVFVRP